MSGRQPAEGGIRDRGIGNSTAPTDSSDSTSGIGIGIYLLLPGLYSLSLWGGLRCAGLALSSRWLLGFQAGFVGLGAILFFRRLEGALFDGIEALWARLRHSLLPGVYRLVIAFSRTFLNAADALLYSVDERLRFGTGQEGRVVLACRLMGGVLWFLISYVFRAYVKVLVEPQVNPIKHFPVVTVCHKLLLPYSKTLFLLFFTPFATLFGTFFGSTAAGLTVLLIPGVFGFLAWELKENWKLYRANQAENLAAVPVTSRGETVARLLRPGFHSGRLIGLYRRLRRQGSDPKAQAELERVRGDITAFVEREFVAILDKALPSPLTVSAVRVASNRIEVELRGGGKPLNLVFEEQSGWILGSVAAPDFWLSLEGTARIALKVAILGLYKLAGADLLREDLERAISPGALYDVADRGLVYWSRADPSRERRMAFSGRRDWWEVGVPVFARRRVPFGEWEELWNQIEKRESPLSEPSWSEGLTLCPGPFAREARGGYRSAELQEVRTVSCFLQ